jgi:hypothetical protein
MEKIDILLWAVGGGFLITFGIMKIMWSAMNKGFDKVDQRFDKVDQRFDKVEEKITDIDRRLCRLEGAFSSKD